MVAPSCRLASALLSKCRTLETGLGMIGRQVMLRAPGLAALIYEAPPAEDLTKRCSQKVYRNNFYSGY